MGAGQSLEDYQSSQKLGAKTKMTETACFDFRQDLGAESRRHSDHSLVPARGRGAGMPSWQTTNQTGVPQFRLGTDWGGGESSSNVSRDTSRDVSRKTSNEIFEDHPAFLPKSGRSSNRWSSSSSTSTSSNISSCSTDSQCSSLMMVQGDEGYVDLTSGVQSWSRKKLEKRSSFNENGGPWEGQPTKKFKRTFFNS